MLGHPKLVTVLLLGCIALALFSLSQVANSQSLTTLTALQTFTSTSVSAVTSTLTSTTLEPQAVRYDLAPLDFNNRTGMFTLSYTEISPYYPQNQLCLMYDYFLVNATTAYEFKVHFDTQQDIPVNFLILNMIQFNQFNHSNCANGFSDWELRAVAPASDLVWVVPQPGEYVFLFLSGQFVGGYIHLSVEAYGQAIQTSTFTYMTNSSIEELSTQAVVSTLSATTATVSIDYSTWSVGGVIIALALFVVILATRTRKARKQPAHE